MSKKTEEPKIELSLEAMKEIYKEQEEFANAVVDYDLPDMLEDVSKPLSFGEKKKLKKFDLKKIDTMSDDDLDRLIVELLSLRGLKDEDIDPLEYSDLQMWVRKVVLTTFNMRVIAKKK